MRDTRYECGGGKTNRILSIAKPKRPNSIYSGYPGVLQHICQLVEKEIIKPVIDRKYRFDEILEAHLYVDTGHKKGNFLVTLEE